MSEKAEPDETAFVLTNARIATMAGRETPYGMIDAGALAVENGQIVWVGPGADLPSGYAAWPRRDLGGRLVTPGLIDCHTHLVFGGNRAQEFELRLNGASYEEVARAGGGIVATVAATRAASQADLIDAALPRLDHLIAEGVTTLEIKSGYGLDHETELKMLRAARALGKRRDVTIRTSFLGAHAVPGGDDPDTYIDQVCCSALHAAWDEGLVDAVDGFCEGIAFSPDQIARVFDAAARLDLPVKLHAEQLSHLGGTALAAKYKALSADHLEHATEADAAHLAQSGTVAVMLPGAFYTLRDTKLPPIEAFRSHQVPMAIATDCNPGSSPLTSLLLAMNMGCTLFRMTPEEALTGVTAHAAQALGLADRGRLGIGLRADLCLWDVEQPGELSYRIGFNPLYRRMVAGRVT